MKNTTVAEKPIKISIRNLYKIFGAAPASVLQDVYDGMGKEELLTRRRHVLGLSDINIHMREGETTVIMGLSGSGKSTLIRHINRLIEPTAGEVLVDGMNVLDLNEADLRKLRRTTMSMVFQNFALLPHRTVLQNAGLAQATQGTPIAAYTPEAERWLDRVGLSGYGGHYPHQLSGGMQQRVGIARALTSNAGIMLMDEAFSALDPLIRNDMQDLLLELQRELHKTIIFISHDLDEALKLADHLVILKDGLVVQQGEPQDILLNPCDPYIEAFISDINRARVLRVRSIMAPPDDSEVTGTVQAEDNLEQVLSLSGGNHANRFRVMDGERPVGILEMDMLLRALVPRKVA